jgi:hypothetical protein
LNRILPDDFASVQPLVRPSPSRLTPDWTNNSQEENAAPGTKHKLGNPAIRRTGNPNPPETAAFAYLDPYILPSLQVLEGFARPLLSAMTAILYVNNIQTNILGPSGAESASVGPTDSWLDQLVWAGQINSQAEWFTDNLGDLGDQHDPTNAYLTCGADRWNMSARDYGRFIAHLINNELQPNPWPTMRDTRAPGAASTLPPYAKGDARLGVWRFQGLDGTGNYYGHNGEWSDAFTGWMAFPDNVSVVFFANSTHDNTKFHEQEQMILDSWLAS